MTTGITASQARENSESSNHGTPEILRSINQSIEAASKTGVTFIHKIMNKEAVSESELQGAIAALEERGFTVERAGTTASQYTIKISW